MVSHSCSDKDGDGCKTGWVIENTEISQHFKGSSISLNLKGQIMENSKRCQDLECPPSRKQPKKGTSAKHKGHPVLPVWFGLVWFGTGSYYVALARMCY